MASTIPKSFSPEGLGILGKHPIVGKFADLLSNVRGFKNVFAPAAPVKQEHLPGLRALIKKQFPNAGIHERGKIEERVKPHIGPTLDSILGNATDMNSYANAINNASKYNPNIEHLLNLGKSVVSEANVEGSQGYQSFPSSDGGFGTRVNALPSGVGSAKQTVSAYQINPGADALDTTIPKKVESSVNGDYFNYLAANPENGEYNVMYLMDKQWEKEVKYANPLDLPRSGDDQQYFLSMSLLPQNDNQQNVEMELTEKYTDAFYALQMKLADAESKGSVDILKDSYDYHDPLMNRLHYGHFKSVDDLEGDSLFLGKNPDNVYYPDPEQPQSSAFMNKVGFRSIYDSWTDPYQKSRFDDIDLVFSSKDQYGQWLKGGFQVFSQT